MSDIISNAPDEQKVRLLEKSTQPSHNVISMQSRAVLKVLYEDGLLPCIDV